MFDLSLINALKYVRWPMLSSMSMQMVFGGKLYPLTQPWKGSCFKEKYDFD